MIYEVCLLSTVLVLSFVEEGDISFPGRLEKEKEFIQDCVNDFTIERDQ